MSNECEYGIIREQGDMEFIRPMSEEDTQKIRESVNNEE